ncbi:MAG: M20/M25/M40 family metallo-hydrolase [Chitinophagaceae bacterium]|nr:M20/M25/M40 family metallo-hydrolase [Chitinophagaceae bacterium]
MNRFLVSALSLVLMLSASIANSQVVSAPYSNVKLDSAKLLNDLAYISSPTLEGRLVGTEGNRKAREYIARRFEQLKLDSFGSGRFQSFPARNGATGVNVIGMIKGKLYPDQYYVITAHYDHLGKKGDKIYTGADDNASGTAALLAIAERFKKTTPSHSIIFVACDAEEGGLMGSRYFVEHPPVDISTIKFNLNMDMLSRSDKNEIYACGIYHYPFLSKYIKHVQEYVTGIHVIAGHDDPSKGASDDWTTQSDHYPFHQKKIPFLYFGVEDHPDYHQPTDSFEKVNKSFYYQVCNMIASLMMSIDAHAKID